MTNHKPLVYNVFSEEKRAGSMAATLAERLISTRNANLNESLSDFEGSAHKLELVKTIEGVDFINDSRSTNVNSVWFALESMTKPITWIMNIDKLEDISEDLLEVVNQKVNRIIIQGVYNLEIFDFFTGLNKEVQFSMNLEEAVRNAYYSCKQGDVVLFSPGNTSSGMYRTYRERGDKFKDAVAQL